jgi:hypothetical protein
MSENNDNMISLHSVIMDDHATIECRYDRLRKLKRITKSVTQKEKEQAVADYVKVCLEAEIEKLRKVERIAYLLARHIRNTDEIPVLTWAVEGGELLAELRALNSRRYDWEVSAKTHPEKTG